MESKLTVYVQSKSGEHNAVFESATSDLSKVFTKLREKGGYYSYTHETPQVMKFVSFNEIEFIREATDDDIV